VAVAQAVPVHQAAPVAVAQPVHVHGQPVYVQPSVQPGYAQPAQPYPQPGYAQPAQPYPQPAQPYPQAAQPPVVQAMARTTYTVNALGFWLKDREYELQAERLGGCYVSGICHFFPIPCLQCLHFKAKDTNTLELDLVCCCGVPICKRGAQVTYTRDFPNGHPNQFTAPGTTFEFGKFNGLCTGASGEDTMYDTCCYLHVARC